MTAPMKFDVHRSKYPSSELGALLDTIEAVSHRAAREAAEQTFAGMAVVVVPHRRVAEKLAAAIRRLKPRAPRDYRQRRTW